MASSKDKYVCMLDERSARKAKKELNEDAKDRLNAVDALRTWIQQQPHITFKLTGQSQISIRPLRRLNCNRINYSFYSTTPLAPVPHAVVTNNTQSWAH